MAWSSQLYVSVIFVSCLVAVKPFSQWFSPSIQDFTRSSASDGLSSIDSSNKANPHRAQLKNHELDLISVYESRRESVVYISTLSQTFNPFSLNLMEIPTRCGSGFVWDDNHIVTNNHVIDNQKEVLVTFVNVTDGSRESLRAKVRGVDPEKDIAVLKVIKSATKILPPPLPLADSKTVIVGQTVAAIGNPFGLDQTLTSGIVSGLGRQIKSHNGHVIYDMIQTDAAINPGNSGGPLLDSNGNLLGMNTAILSSTGTFAGVGFAIPVDVMRVVVSCIIQTGTFVKPSTGIQFIGGHQARMLGIENGLIVLRVQPGSAAERAGLRAIPNRNFYSSLDVDSADIILKVNGKTVESEADFLQAIYSKIAGDTIRMIVKRSMGTIDQQNPRIHKEIELQLRLK